MKGGNENHNDMKKNGDGNSDKNNIKELHTEGTAGCVGIQLHHVNFHKMIQPKKLETLHCPKYVDRKEIQDTCGWSYVNAGKPSSHSGKIYFKLISCKETKFTMEKTYSLNVGKNVNKYTFIFPIPKMIVCYKWKMQ